MSENYDRFFQMWSAPAPGLSSPTAVPIVLFTTQVPSCQVGGDGRSPHPWGQTQEPSGAGHLEFTKRRRTTSDRMSHDARDAY